MAGALGSRRKSKPLIVGLPTSNAIEPPPPSSITRPNPHSCWPLRYFGFDANFLRFPLKIVKVLAKSEIVKSLKLGSFLDRSIKKRKVRGVNDIRSFTTVPTAPEFDSRPEGYPL